MSNNDPWTELQKIVDADLERSERFVRGVVTTSGALRGFVVTLWSAGITAAATTGVAAWAFLGAVATVAFGLVDAYHAWLADVAIRHVRTLERITQARHDALARGEDDSAFVDEYHAQLLTHRFGLYTYFDRFQWRELRHVTPRVIFRGLYPTLVAIAIGVAAYMSVTGSAISPQGTTTHAAPLNPSVSGSPHP